MKIHTARTHSSARRAIAPVASLCESPSLRFSGLLCLLCALCAFVVNIAPAAAVFWNAASGT
jgi:hypothetical protein